MNSIAFLWDGARIRAEQTPDEVSVVARVGCTPAEAKNWAERLT